MAATWTVHQHSDRTGVRLTGPVPEWARADGGEAGLHPSNILDSAYGVGTVMLAGDMAVVVGPDGPSLGGFVAIAQVIRADLWKLGQVRAGDAVTLEPGRTRASRPRSRCRAEMQHRTARAAARSRHADPRRARATAPVGRSRSAAPASAALLVEFGEPVLDLRSRVRAHLLRAALEEERLPASLDLTPGVRSLHVHHDPDRLPTQTLLRAARRTRARAARPARDDRPRPRRPPPARLARIRRDERDRALPGVDPAPTRRGVRTTSSSSAA